MNRRARTLVLTLFAAVLLANPAAAQAILQPTPHPTVTAENERWYLNGEPITNAGTLYYPAGPRVHFLPDEMVRSGFYQGVPLYSRTTIEPHSIVYVPVGGALMQPYERQRMGLSGSVPTSLPTISPSAVTGAPLQAAGPPSGTTTEIPVYVPRPVASAGVATTPATEPAAAGAPTAVGTSGRHTPRRRPTHTSIGGRPQGSNSIFIEYAGARWYKAGDAEPIDPTQMTRAGSYSGVPVWTKTASDDAIIYVPVMQEGGSLAVPYARKQR